ncbi:hypothetical protein, partial [Streptomyces sp. P17]
PLQDEAKFMVRAARIDVGEVFKQRELMGSVTETWGETKEIIASVRKLLTSGRSIEVSLRMLQARLLQYGIWTALIGTIAS